jgi:hypothetical protein
MLAALESITIPNCELVFVITAYRVLYPLTNDAGALFFGRSAAPLCGDLIP